MRALYDEMAALETQEAQIYKALDKLEAVISHNESDISTWENHEYDLQLTYGEQNVAFFALPDGASSGCPAGIARQDRTRG